MTTSTILVGNCVDVLKTIPDESVRCCVTSPPYFGLRDYGTGDWEGGDPACDHRHKNARMDHSQGTMLGTRGEQDYTAQTATPMRAVCSKCGARRKDDQIGLEPDVDTYLERLVGVFREVRRVLTKDGTLWVNLGDSYAGGGCGARDAERWPKQSRNDHMPRHAKKKTGVRAKNLLGVPWAFAFAMRDDGWFLRSDIIWHKDNAMPESVDDRPTKAHEYVFLFSKRARYFYDREAIREDPKPWNEGMMAAPKMGPERLKEGARNQNVKKYDEVKGGNRRSVWTINTEPFPGAHFAVMPTELARLCVLAGSAPGDTVLDTFVGSGTVGLVATSHSRSFIGIDLNPAFAEIARERIAGGVSAEAAAAKKDGGPKQISLLAALTAPAARDPLAAVDGDLPTGALASGVPAECTECDDGVVWIPDDNDDGKHYSAPCPRGCTPPTEGP